MSHIFGGLDNIIEHCELGCSCLKKGDFYDDACRSSSSEEFIKSKMNSSALIRFLTRR